MDRLFRLPPVLLLAALAAAPWPGGAAQAAVSGYYDSAAKIAAILAEPDVADALRQAPIRSIEEEGMAENGISMWLVHSQDCDLQVGLRARSPEGPGRVEWVVETLGRCD